MCAGGIFAGRGYVNGGEGYKEHQRYDGGVLEHHIQARKMKYGSNWSTPEMRKRK